MNPRPIFDNPEYKAAGKLRGKKAIITGGDSGIGRAVAVAFAKEGANVAIAYLNERRDALETKEWVEKYGGNCLLIETDLRIKENAINAVEKTIDEEVEKGRTTRHGYTTTIPQIFFTSNKDAYGS